MLLDLPEELISLVFSWVDGRSLVRCQQVSRQCARIIQRDLRLTYRINLFSANMIDNTNHNASLAERSACLKSFIKSREEGNWSTPKVLQSPFSHIPSYIVANLESSQSWPALSFSNLLVISARTCLYCVDASEVALGGEAHQRELRVAGFPTIPYFYIFPEHDLLLIKELELGQFIFHPFSLETGRSHPKASGVLPPVVSPLAMSALNDFSLCGEYLLVWVDHGIRDPYFMKGRFTILNWTTGTIYRTIFGSYAAGAFLNTSHVICLHVTAEKSTGYLKFRLDVYSIHGQSSDPPIICFEYPPIRSTTFPDVALLPPAIFLVNGSLSSTSTRGKRLPFVASPEDSILMFCTQAHRRVSSPWEDLPWQLTSVFLISSILSRVRAAEATWDGQNTVTIPPNGWEHFTVPMWNEDVLYLYGTRMLVEREGSNVLTIYDFDRKSIAENGVGTASSKSFTAPDVRDIPWVDVKQVDEVMPIPRVQSFKLDVEPNSAVDLDLDEDTVMVLTEGRQGAFYVHSLVTSAS
ncbi:hypothetical protein BDN72DRAFT_957069 [Pluteus cervinus]|uniref:Uncharacterized protein n=1 Tax=Pluteus cervinus TaxID=181527 RepID=A0ACD3B3N2_9AGAR|nr:hypothetical protein BDN72DRAFT_957069 [Pluteus cervinus]